MINLLIDIGLSFSFCSLFLLSCRYFGLTIYGPKISYLSWLLIPLSLIVPCLSFPNWFAELNQGQSIQGVMRITSNISTQQTTLFNTQWLLVGIWLCGFLAFAGLCCYQYITLLRSQKQWQKASSSEQIFIKHNLLIFKSEAIGSPMLVGLIKPKLVLPADFNQLFSEEQQTLILEHELCHFKRNDMVWNSIAVLLLALLWFHPLAWLVFSRYRRDQELSCDQVVLARKHIASRINYGRALLLAAETSPKLSFSQLSFKEYGDKYMMLERIKLIKKQPKGSSVLSVAMLAGAVTLLSAMSYAGDHKNKVLAASQNEAIIIKRIEPKYPINAAKNKVEGSVALSFDILPNGSLANILVVKGQPEKIFDKVAIRALENWLYKPSVHGFTNMSVQLDFAMDEVTVFPK